MIKLNILYEDNHLLVIVKPPNVLVQKDNTNDIDLVTEIKSYLKTKYNKPGNVYLGLVHRLDRPVGGVMVFAKTSKSAKRLSESIKKLEFKKEYLAVVKGNIKKENTLINYIDRSNKIAFITDDKSGKYAELEYKVIDKQNDLNLVKINLVTGRHHQIRIQFKNIGFPIYGDQLYGISDKQPIALFSYKLTFIHPITKEVVSFKNIPSDNIWEYFNMEGIL